MAKVDTVAHSFIRSQENKDKIREQLSTVWILECVPLLLTNVVIKTTYFIHFIFLMLKNSWTAQLNQNALQNVLLAGKCNRTHLWYLLNLQHWMYLTTYGKWTTEGQRSPSHASNWLRQRNQKDIKRNDCYFGSSVRKKHAETLSSRRYTTSNAAHTSYKHAAQEYTPNVCINCCWISVLSCEWYMPRAENSLFKW